MTIDELLADPGFNERLWAFVAAGEADRKDSPEAFVYARVLATVTKGLVIELEMLRQGLSRDEATALAEERLRELIAMYGSLAAMEAT
jgi:hypothetical protein